MTDTSATAALAPAPAAADAAPAAPAATPQATPQEAAPAAPEPGLQLPGKDATPEQWYEFYGKLGRPEKAEDYGLTVREGEDADFVNVVAGVMHQYGLTKAQAQGLQKELEAKAGERLAKGEADRVAAQDRRNETEQKELRTELGEKFEPQMELARRAVRQFAGGDAAAEVLGALEAALGYKATIELWMRIGQGLGEHDATSAGRGQGEGERKPTQSILYGG